VIELELLCCSASLAAALISLEDKQPDVLWDPFPAGAFEVDYALSHFLKAR